MSDVALFDEVRSLAFGGISGSYAEVGTPFTHVIRIIKFVNNTDGDIILSLDGVTDHDVLPAGSLCVYDLTTNRADNNLSWAFPKGTQVYIKQSSAPTSGSFYVVVLYQRGQ